jgi:hypothetical protein
MTDENPSTYECPACGDSFASLNALNGHWAGSRSDSHSGSLSDYEGTKSDTTDPDDSEDDVLPDDDNPTMGSGDVDTGEPELELPCGHESIRESELPDNPVNMTCEECGQTYGYRP